MVSQHGIWTSYEDSKALSGDLHTNGAIKRPITVPGIEETPLEIRSCIHHLIEEAVKLQPCAIALESTNQSFTYAQLRHEWGLLSQRLQEAGVRKGDRVACLMEKSNWVPITMIAILSIGSIIVPLDPAHPLQRLATTVKNADISVAVVSSESVQTAEKLPFRTHITLSSDTNSTRKPVNYQCCMLEPETSSTPDDVAVIIFTSGSTGAPKGVLLTHSAICSSAHHQGAAMFLQNKSRVLQYAPYTFDISIYDIFTTLIKGGTVFTPSEDERLNAVVEIINSKQIDWACLVPSLLTTFEPEDVPNIRTIALAAEMAPKAVIDKWVARVNLINCYGSTEASTCIPGHFYVGSGPGFMGEPKGIVPFVVDPADHRTILPPGEMGELLVVGPVLSSGYLNDLPRTESAFPTDFPYPQGLSHFRAYRTGDMVEKSANGELRYLGRKDSLVKVRGQRVELGEVEHHVRAHPLVFAASIFFPRDGMYATQIVAIVQMHHTENGKRNSEIDAQAIDLHSEFADARHIKDFLKARLPVYMLPSHILRLAKLPMTSSGKVDRVLLLRLLTDSNLSFNQSRGAHETINSSAFALDQKIMDLLPTSSFLRHPREYDDIELQLGGFDSIRLMALSRFIKTTYGRSIDIRQLAKQSKSSLRSLIQTNESQVSTSTPGLSDELSGLLSKFTAYEASKKHQSPKLVLLTGAAGFLGSHVLHQLLRLLPCSTHIAALVRASNAFGAQLKLLSTLEKHGLNLKSTDFARIEVWKGDLGLRYLGLDSVNWQRLNGYEVAASDEDESSRTTLLPINSVVHCGAAVDWAAEYASLKAANVESTLQLLKCLEKSRPQSCGPGSSNFIYVSGGRTLEFALQVQTDTIGTNGVGLGTMSPTSSHASKMLAIGEASTVPLSGYDATKLVGDTLVLSVGPRFSHTASSILRPGYIIGNVQNGYVSTKDFIWCLVAAAVRLGKRCQEDEEAWLYMADVQSVAKRIVLDFQIHPAKAETSTNSATAAVNQVNMTEGLCVDEFWKIISESLNTKLDPVNSDDWIRLLQSDVDSTGIEHPMYPFILTHSAEEGKIGMGGPDLTRSRSDLTEQAIRKTVEFLRRQGHFKGLQGDLF